MDAMLRRMTSAQFTEWMAFAELEPFGPLREDYRSGVVASAAYNAAPFRGRGAPTVKPSDHFASLRPPRRRQTVEEMAAFARAQTLRMGGRIGKIKRQ